LPIIGFTSCPSGTIETISDNYNAVIEDSLFLRATCLSCLVATTYIKVGCRTTVSNYNKGVLLITFHVSAVNASYGSISSHPWRASAFRAAFCKQNLPSYGSVIIISPSTAPPWQDRVLLSIPHSGPASHTHHLFSMTSLVVD
jgi:hypothetical protein